MLVRRGLGELPQLLNYWDLGAHLCKAELTPPIEALRLCGVCWVKVIEVASRLGPIWWDGHV